MSSQTIETGYVVVAKELDPEKRGLRDNVYYAIDSNSGGYPYWSSVPGSAFIFKKIVDAVYAINECNREKGGVSYMSQNVMDISVYKQVLVLEKEVDITQILKMQALQKLTVEERRLLGLE